MKLIRKNPEYNYSGYGITYGYWAGKYRVFVRWSETFSRGIYAGNSKPPKPFWHYVIFGNISFLLRTLFLPFLAFGLVFWFMFIHMELEQVKEQRYKLPRYDFIAIASILVSLFCKAFTLTFIIYCLV